MFWFYYFYSYIKYSFNVIQKVPVIDLLSEVFLVKYLREYFIKLRSDDNNFSIIYNKVIQKKKKNLISIPEVKK